MSEKEKTHYRKAFNSPYLSSADIVEPMVFTVKHVNLEKDKTKKTQDFFNTIYWLEKEIRPGEELKPMILNATNSKTMKSLTGSPFIEDWGGTPVTVYVDPHVRFGRDTVEGLRIATERPNTVKPELKPGDRLWGNAIASYKKNKSFDEVIKHVTISDENKELIKKAAYPDGEQQ